jgi:hypothetical protein
MPSPRSLTLLVVALVASLGPIATAGAPSVAPAATATPPTPPPDWFEVELIVFRHTQPGAGASETWPADPGRPAVEGARELDPTATALAPFMALPPTASRLTASWDKLVKSSRYEPIAYFAWLQPPLERGKSPAVRIASPPPPPTPVDPAAAPSTAPAPAFAFAPDPNAPADAAPAEPPPPPLRTPLDGTATVGLQRYLYLALDLVFQPGDLPPLVDGTPMPPFRLTETRRMRSKELHYFDHPLFGALVLITPRPAPPELIDPATGLPKPEAAAP